MIALYLLACGKDDGGGGAAHYDDPVDQLEVPPLDGIDLETVFVDGLKLALRTDLRAPWSAHTQALAMGQADCPNVYAGTPDLDLEDLSSDVAGLSWLDHCSGDQAAYGGWIWWENTLSTEGDASTAEGQVQAGSRTIMADGVVNRGDEVLFEIDGDGADSFTLETAPGYTHWDYSSTLDATVSGSLAFPPGDALEGGLRTDLYVRYQGGDADTLEVRGNTYLFDGLIDGKFDSTAVDLEMDGPTNAAPDVCDKEPRGTLSVRDEDAFWYDVVFEPIETDDATGEEYEPDPYTACDGCGELYVRGIDQGVQVCPDFDFLWDGSTLVAPNAADFAWSPRPDLEDP